MTKDQTIQYIHNRLNEITRTTYTTKSEALSYQIGFLMSIVADEMLRDSHVYDRFVRRVRSVGGGPAAKG